MGQAINSALRPARGKVGLRGRRGQTNWEARWEAQRPAAVPMWADNVRISKAFRGRHLRLYESLAKAEGAVLCQARMGFFTEGEVWEGLSDHRKAPGLEAKPSNVTAGTQAPPLPPALASAPLTLTKHSASDDRCKGFYPAGTVSLVDSTGWRHRTL